LSRSDGREERGGGEEAHPKVGHAGNEISKLISVACGGAFAGFETWRSESLLR
jgi:hypothetical protein